MKTERDILICPLEWGFGHAARMIPVARALHDRGHNIWIASGEEHLIFMKKELPELNFISFPGFNPSYSKYLPQYLTMIFKLPALIKHTIKEHRELDRLIDKYSIDILISDNRFGLWNKRIKTAYVTHMPRIPFPFPFRFLEFIGIALHRLIIKKYDFCLIPDLPGDLNLTGKLTHGFRLTSNSRFIGILSRFAPPEDKPDQESASKDKDLVILSGPEPQKSIFRDRLLTFLENEKRKTIVLEGKPGNEANPLRSGEFEFHTHPDEKIMRSMILSASRIISRSGYTTVMELATLGRSAILVPTPGQTEQEYLAKSLASKDWFGTVSQKNIGKGIPLLKTGIAIPLEIVKDSSVLLARALDELSEYHEE